MRAIAVSALGVTKRFGAFTALDDVTLEVRAGTVHALLGENGAGKSTLVKCLLGYYRADTVAFVVDGREVAIERPADAARLGLGMVYQHFTLVPSMTAAENLVMAREAVPAVVDWATERAGPRSPALPVPARRPRRRTVTSSATAATSFSLWVMMTMESCPASARPRTRPSISSASCGVSTEVGSSRTRKRRSR